MSIVVYAVKGNLGNFWKKLDKVSHDTNMSKIKLFNKFLSCFLKIGSGYSDFLNYELYNKSKREIKEYVTVKDQDKFYEIVSPSKYKTFFTVKPNFLKNFSKYIKRDFFYDGTLEELNKFLDNNESFMIKPIDGLGGSGVKKLSREKIENVLEFYQRLQKDNLFLEGYVKQHEEMNKLCSSSVNTIRVMSFSYNGESVILFASLRVGNGKYEVDNFHKGGMGVLIDLETGSLVGNAIDKDLNEFTHHPVSKIKFDGFKIPNWDIIKNTVLEAAKVNNNIHVVGWDVAVTPDGCTFIEGNRRPGFDLVQVVSKKGRKDIMRNVLDKINKIEGTNYKI